MKMVLRLERSRITKLCLSRPQRTLEDQLRRPFQTKKVKRAKRRFILFLAKLPNMSLLIYHLLPSIKSRNHPLYFQHTPTIPCTLPPTTYHSPGQYQKCQLSKKDRDLTLLHELLIELLPELLIANLATWMQPQRVPNPPPRSPNPNV